ncbi:MAG: hypothetical protein GY861_09290 [bacterium]|nr:hypothetical protein [bacterium]
MVFIEEKGFFGYKAKVDAGITVPKSLGYKLKVTAGAIAFTALFIPAMYHYFTDQCSHRLEHFETEERSDLEIRTDGIHDLQIPESGTDMGIANTVYDLLK